MVDNFDDLIQQMKADELADASKLTPREYGRLRGIAPQLVYYHLKTHNDPTQEKYLQAERCLCGKTVIDIKLADQYFGKGEFDPTSDFTNKEED